MKKWIPFLDLSIQHRNLAGLMEKKFSRMLQEGIFAGGKEIDLLENQIGRMLSIPHAIACSNGTDALEMALRIVGIGHGDEVVIPALTWISTAEAVANVGASPVFVDVSETGLMDLSEVKKLIRPKTKGILPVHLFGKMVEMSEMMDLASINDLKVVEDGAQAFGSFQNGKSACSFGDIGCFSFYPTKNLGALGEAGMLVTQNAEHAEKLRWLHNHGQSQMHHHEIKGRNGKMDTIQAGFLNVKITFFEAWQKKRKELALMYWKGLKEIEPVFLPLDPGSPDYNVHIFPIQVAERDKLRSYLSANGIGTALHYPKILPRTRAFSNPISYPMAEKVSSTSISLPLNPFLSEEDVQFIINKIQVFFG